MVLCWKKDHVEKWSGGLHCSRLGTKGKYPGAKGLRGDNSCVPLFLCCSKPIKILLAATSALDHGFISLNSLAGRVGENFIYSFSTHRIFDKKKQV